MIVRRPAVAGQFYPGSKDKLEKTIADLLSKSAASLREKESFKGVVLPHAGYVYSGQVAAETVSRLELKDTCILLGPNHTGLGEPFSVMTEGLWQMPLGDVPIDSKLAESIVKNSKYLKEDVLAHKLEHSLEVIVPFLQFLKKDIKIVPVILTHADVQAYRSIAEDILKGIESCRRQGRVSIIASSDMTHYEPQESAKRKDHLAIDSVVKLDVEGLLNRVDEHNITMCGVVPVAVMLNAAKRMGATEGRLVKYQTSGDASGDYSSVVGYAGITIH